MTKENHVKNIGRGLRVYVAGPVNGSGTQSMNARKAIEAAQMLSDHGFVPFVPNLFWMWHLVMPHVTEHEVMKWCESWLKTCDIMIRLPGTSPGADAEEKLAIEHGIRVIKCFDGIDDDHMIPARLLLIEAKKWEYSDIGPSECRSKLLPMVSVDSSDSDYSPIDYSWLSSFQRSVSEWIMKQPFASQPKHQPLLGAIEELGELAHAHLKNEQGIRGFDNVETANAAKEDAIGDVIVYLAGYCDANGIDLAKCVGRAWEEVRRRDWTKNRKTGKDDQPSPYSS